MSEKAPEVGLILDGDVRGVYAIDAVQEYARELGWDGTIVKVGEDNWEYALYDAETWLNTNISKEPNYFYWQDGSLFYGQRPDEELFHREEN